MRDGSPAFVTVMAPTDEPGGWRTMRNDSGAVLDVASGEPVTTGLAMPHSPRWHDGNLFVLNSGMGRLEHVDPATGHREAIAAVPGYARGLAFHRDLAFVGLSRIRESAIFGGAPIAASTTNSSVASGSWTSTPATPSPHWQCANGVEEIFDVQTVPGARCPTFGGSPGDDDEIWLLAGNSELTQPRGDALTAPRP